MHINTLFFRALKAAGAVDAWLGLEWNARSQLLTALCRLATKILVTEADGLATLGPDITRHTDGVKVLEEVISQALRKWVNAR
jgi:hypothetical protein